ncbi:MAG: hypothetical protein JWQ33_1502, partial [Ramlibacter sp.]|nr:hypothetical protein [Ramlibacter sp.]
MASTRPAQPVRDVATRLAGQSGARDLPAPIAPIAQEYIAMLVMSLAGRLT